MGKFFTKLLAGIRVYGPAISMMFLGIVLFLFLLNVNFQQIQRFQSIGPEAEQAWDMITDIIAVFASGFLGAGGIAIGQKIQNQHLKAQEQREIRRRTAQEYREYLTWLLKIGQHADFVHSDPGLRAKLPEQGRQFEITAELRASVISKMPLFWEFTSLDNDTNQTVSTAVNDALEYLSIVSNHDANNGLTEEKFIRYQRSYADAMNAITVYELK